MDIVRTAIGLMSGTSMDGIDVALLRTDGRTFIERGPFLGVPYDPEFRDRLKQALEIAKPLTDRSHRPVELAAIERELTQRHADAVATFLEKFGLTAAEIDVLGFHGQTVLHRPDEALTVQIGDGAMLARETGISVVYDMRANDMVHGGQGAPLVPAYHAALASRFQRDGQPVCFVNIGGISNLTFIGTDGRIAAFDSGPGNTLIDQWVEMQTGQAFDDRGRIAGSGHVLPELAARYLESPFFRGNVRRSLDRGDFKPLQPDEAGLEDGARTLAHVAAASIVKCAHFLPEPPRVFIVCGGGRLNATIMDELTALAGKSGGEVVSAEDVGFDGDAMEAEAWAYLAVRSLDGLPLTFPGTTGVSEPVSGGVFARPWPVLDTERLRLEAWETDDAISLHHLHGTDETARFVGDGDPWSIETARSRISGWLEEYARQGISKLKLIADSDGRFMGRAGFSWFPEKACFELGYAIVREEWGKGYASEIATGLMRWFFSARQEPRFIAFAFEDNAASIRVMQKIGLEEIEPFDHRGRRCRCFEMTRGRYEFLYGARPGDATGPV